MAVIPPSGEVSQSTAMLPAVIKANVIAIIADAGGPAAGSRLTGTVSGSADGQAQIYTSSGTITVAPVTRLADGATVTLTLRAAADGLVAQIRPVTSPSRNSAPPVGSIAPLTTPTIAPSNHPGAAASVPRLSPAAPPPLTSPMAIESAPIAFAPVPDSGPPVAPQRPPSAPPTDMAGRVSPPAPAATAPSSVASGVAAVSTPTTNPMPSPTAAIDAVGGDSLSFVVAAKTSQSPTTVGRGLAPIQPSLEAIASGQATALAVVVQRSQPDGSRPLLPVDPGPLLDLLQLAGGEEASAGSTAAASDTTRAARTPKHDLDGFGVALAAFIDAHPATARSLLASALPQPNGNLGKVLHAFAIALGQADSTIWLGPNLARQVASASPAMAAHLSQLVDDRAQPTSTGPGSWREAALPLVTPAGLMPLRLMVEEKAEGEHADRSAASTGSPTRLILECTLSRFDRIQLDALVRKPQRCDVIVRSTAPLPAEVQATVAHAFAGVAAQNGLTGAIAFQAVPAGFVDPPPPRPPGGSMHLSA